MNARAAITDVQRVSDLVAAATRQPALRMRLLSGFALASLLLAGIGVYGVAAQAVATRHREAAIRIALGAAPREIMGHHDAANVTRRHRGVGIGVVAALLLGGTLETVLYGVQSRDASSFFVAGVTLLAVTALAAFVPARRAMSVDPIAVLRAE